VRIVIHPGNQSITESIQELGEYRDLLWMLTVRHIRVRYKQAVIGVGWVLLQPIVAMVIFSIIFGNFAKLDGGTLPYPVFVYAALVLWTLLSESVSRASISLLADEKLVTKVYFPRLVIPLAAVGSAWIDFVVSLFVLLPLVWLYGLRPTWSLILLPISMLATMILASGVGLILAALNVRYRDFQYTVPFLLQVWLYASPVIYSTQIVPETIRPIYYLNPMAGLIELGRFAVSGQGHLSLVGLALSGLSAILALGLGATVFRWVEHRFADYI
jgi:lipopolysaccharide transport system permease protein